MGHFYESTIASCVWGFSWFAKELSWKGKMSTNSRLRLYCLYVLVCSWRTSAKTSLITHIYIHTDECICCMLVHQPAYGMYICAYMCVCMSVCVNACNEYIHTCFVLSHNHIVMSVCMYIYTYLCIIYLYKHANICTYIFANP